MICTGCGREVYDTGKVMAQNDFEKMVFALDHKNSAAKLISPSIITSFQTEEEFYNIIKNYIEGRFLLSCVGRYIYQIYNEEVSDIVMDGLKIFSHHKQKE